MDFALFDLPDKDTRVVGVVGHFFRSDACCMGSVEGKKADRSVLLSTNCERLDDRIDRAAFDRSIAQEFRGLGPEPRPLCRSGRLPGFENGLAEIARDPVDDGRVEVAADGLFNDIGPPTARSTMGMGCGEVERLGLDAVRGTDLCDRIGNASVDEENVRRNKK